VRLAKISLLKEITRTISNNQLDYVLIDLRFLNNCFATSYNNFISNHNSTVVRVGLNENQFTDVMKEKITFDRDSHMKPRESTGNSENSSNNSDQENTSLESIHSMEIGDDSECCEQELDSDDQDLRGEADQLFMRKFRNIDMSSYLVELLSSADFVSC
jgi:hypothetical protein